MANRGSDWLAFLRFLVIARRLMMGPASAEDLIRAVIDHLSPEAYPDTLEARRAAFKHDRERLRERLGLRYHYDRVSRHFILLDPGPFMRLPLPESLFQELGLL